MPEQLFITILFLPYSIRAWNDLSEAATETESVNAFKIFLNKDRIPVPKHYYRKASNLAYTLKNKLQFLRSSPVLPRGQDEITWLPGLHEAFPPEATRKRLSHLSALGLVWLQTDSLLEGLEKGVFGSVVYLDLFVIGGMLAEPVVWHFCGDWGRLPLVVTADDLDAPTLEPVEEGFQSGAGHCADLVRDDHTGNEFLSHPLGRPVGLAAPAEEAVICLGLDAPGPHLFGQAMGRVKTRGFLVQKSSIARVVLPLPPPPFR